MRSRLELLWLRFQNWRLRKYQRGNPAHVAEPVTLTYAPTATITDLKTGESREVKVTFKQSWSSDA